MSTPSTGTASAAHAALTLTDVSAAHGRRGQRRTVLAALSLTIDHGESVAVVGRSGAGKSTLADIVLGLHTPASGTVSVDGQPWLSSARRPPPGRRHLVQGVPQDPAAAFVPRWTIRTSIERALRSLTGETGAAALADRIQEAAELAQLEQDLLDHRPAELSGGQAQRAALTRAMAVRPSVLVADEPTSALDGSTAAALSDALLEAVEASHIALLLVTHDHSLAERCTRQVRITAPENPTVVPERTLR